MKNTVTVLIVLVCLTLPKTQAVSPPPDGGYPGGNTAEGQNALFSLTTGGYNTAVGYLSLRSNATNSFNTAIGAGALVLNSGDENTATGVGALLLNTIGGQNTANGALALLYNTTGPFNTAMGHGALYGNTTGDRNTAIGAGALLANSIGASNTAVGVSALRNTTTSFNTAVGHNALAFTTTANSNTALGAFAGTAVTTAHNLIAIGSPGADVSNSCFISNIRGVTTANPDAIPVMIDSAGQLGTVSSSRRFKREIKPMDKSSEAILGFKPVTFHYKSDVKETPQFGLIAEEVAAVNPDLVVRDNNGEIYTVRYDAVNAMLLNEFLKEHREVAELKSIIAEQRKGMEAMAAQLKEQAAQIQKVSAQATMRRSESRMVVSQP